MAKAADKKLAVKNAQALKTLHLVSIIVNAMFMLSYYFLNRPGSLKPYVILSIPAWGLEYVLDKTGRPVGSRPGSDLSAAGLTEYMWDIVYITWSCVLTSVVLGTNKAWILYLVIPGYAVVKLLQLISGFTGNKPATAAADPQLSKRQEKLRQRGLRA
ncbi:hypothetical protein CANCADRAFT_108063 [Tortispora caseinolytica NRRL Y-17796]|uniref:DUF788-domain-containing protein n=1 Tax=Tortispora caseinolytica NRRL Y-17796 TaxID=767744 RepID=A0A1E4TFN4_9ASCO|nr:hypothetical protein CANCADRAFT_108063 [Tortispora caseinolytica NRRL Y-17796]